MNLSFNRRVQADVAEVLRYYDDVGGASLGDEFFQELLAFLEKARLRPERFHRVHGELRRVNLARFPYHILFRTVGETVRILVVRHNRRHPSFGLQRR